MDWTNGSCGVSNTVTQITSDCGQRIVLEHAKLALWTADSVLLEVHFLDYAE